MSKRTQGQEASHSGAKFREQVIAMLVEDGYFLIPPKTFSQCKKSGGVLEQYSQASRTLYPQAKTFTPKASICTSLHGTSLKAHVLLQCPEWKEPLAMFCTKQDTNGTTIHKLPFVTESIKRNSKVRSCLLFDGKAFTEKVLEFYRAEMECSDGKIARVFESLGEFQTFLAKGSPYPVRDLSILDRP